MTSWAGFGPVLWQELCHGPLASPFEVKSMRLLLEQTTLLLHWCKGVNSVTLTPQFEKCFVVIHSFLILFVCLFFTKAISNLEERGLIFSERGLRPGEDGSKETRDQKRQRRDMNYESFIFKSG